MSTTADHVFPREIFQIEQRAMLPKVPACEECNNKKSHLEHYLLSVLPFGATHSNAEKALSVDVKKRLRNNLKLHRKIRNDQGQTYIATNGKILEKRMFIKYDNDKLHKFIGYVGCGLTWFHWSKYLPKDCVFDVFTPAPKGVEFLNQVFYLRTNLRVDTQLGDDTIRYKGGMSEIDDGFTIWAVQLFGGITISSQDRKHIFNNSFVAFLAGKKEMIEIFKR